MKTTVSIIIKIIAILSALINTAAAANRYSIVNGTWTSGTTWSNTSGGATCNCTPSKADNIYINNSITLDKDLTGGSQGLTGILTVNSGASLDGGGTYSLELRSGSTLTINGSLTVKDLTLNSGSNVLFQAGSSTTVNSAFLNKTGSINVTLNGSMSVNGAFNNNSSAIIVGVGSITITTGPAANGGAATIFGLSVGSPCSSFPCVLGSGALPIELIAFSAIRTSFGVEINWATSSETNNDYFTIERALTPLAWETVTTVKGAGNSSHQLHYNYLEANPLITDCFYRIRQTDFDGSSKTFDPVFVAGSNTVDLRLYPNPAAGNKVTVNLGKEDLNTAVIKVYDMAGSEVKTKFSPGRNNSIVNIEIEPDAIKSTRMFYVTVISGDKVLREKLVIN